MATIKLYTLGNNQLKYLQPSKLFCIEDFSTWIGTTASATTLNSMQYIKNDLEIGINLDLSQSYGQPDQKIHYVSIKNDNEGTFYYFVKKTIWRSKSAVRLELVMDVLNTFQDGTDYIFKDNTRIIREHKNRFTITERRISIDYYINLQVGTLGEGDSVKLINDRGDTCFTGKIDYIDSYRVIIIITSNETNTEITNSINDNIQEDFDLELNASNYYLITFDEEDWNISNTIFRDIDIVNENINPLLQCGDSNGTIIEHSKPLLRADWYLLYRNTNDPDPEVLTNPVSCYLIPSEQIATAYGVISAGRLIPSFLEDNKYYYFKIPSGTSFTTSTGHTYTGVGGTALDYAIITKSANKINVSFFRTLAGTTLTLNASYDDVDWIQISPVPCYYNIGDYGIASVSYLDDLEYPYSFNNSGTENKLDPITQLDRTDAKNIKLIKLPYCPFDFSIASSQIQVSADWDFVSLTQGGGGIINCLKLKDLHTDLQGKFTLSSITNNPLLNLKVTTFVPALDDLRKDSSYESKLFHSEFYQTSYVYDSFSFNIQLEKCDVSNYISSRNLLINFDMTRTINSKFMFTFDTYYLRNAEQNYAKCLPIARNNEEVLYNVPYINYVRTGYNYDVKAKNLSNAGNIVSTILSGVSIGASLLFPSAPLKVAGVVTSIVSLANSVKNTIQTAVNNENSIKQKLLQAENQASSVSGSDDVDLMSVYAENRLKYLIYEPTSNMKDLLFKLFFYAGYNSNRMGVPKHNNRVNFDYLECDAVIEATNKNITEEIMTELINSYKNGVTFIHKTDRNSDKWDLEQKYENWEKIFFE